jgi:hypothetical protein
VERSIYHKLKQYITALGKSYVVFNNQVDKKKYKDSHATISIIKVSDVETYANGGGIGAQIDTPVLDTNGNPQSYNRQPWPDSFELMYQVECAADNIQDLRELENIVIIGLRPRQPLYLWDSTAKAFTSEWVELRYAGYINRDIPPDNIYNRIRTVVVSAKSFQPTITIPAITQVRGTAQITDVAFDVEVGS